MVGSGDLNEDVPVILVIEDEEAIQSPSRSSESKPFAPAQLVTAVSNLLNTGAPTA